MMGAQLKCGNVNCPLCGTKESTVKIRLSEAVRSIMADQPFMSKAWIIVWGNNHVAVDTVVNTFRRYQALSEIQRPISGFSFSPRTTETTQADIIIRVTGGPTGMELEITKNRHGKLRTISAMSDCYFKETTVGSNFTPKPWTYRNLQYDAGYAECWRILREAKQDGVITNWQYNSRSPSVVVHHNGCWDGCSVDDLDGTKGDIGILREAADYVLELRKKNEKPDPKTMSNDEITAEILSCGYKLLETTHANHTTPTFGLFRASHGPTGLSLQNDETMPQFLQKCLEHIRGQKK